MIALESSAALDLPPSKGLRPQPDKRRGQPDRTRQSATSSPPATTGGHRAGYLFSPAVDLFFIANVFWPLLLAIDVFGGIATHESLLFWQIFFVTAPHRWITLILVATDHHRTPTDRRHVFTSLGVAILGICLCLRMGTGSLLCLGMIDYVWNAWHFASQHHGVFRIYERKTQLVLSPRVVTCEKFLFRGFMLYVIARVAGWGWSDGTFQVAEWIRSIDYLVLIIPAGALVQQVRRAIAASGFSFGSLAYTTSVMSLFTSLLLAAHFEKSQLVVQLALASAVFHSLEYMSIVTWSMRRTSPSHAPRHWVQLSQMWLLYLAVFVVVIGVGNYLLAQGFFELWVFINLVVAFWHYCFDGLIWKSQKPKSSSTAARST